MSEMQLFRNNIATPKDISTSFLIHLTYLNLQLTLKHSYAKNFRKVHFFLSSVLIHFKLNLEEVQSTYSSVLKFVFRPKQKVTVPP